MARESRAVYALLVSLLGSCGPAVGEQEVCAIGVFPECFELGAAVRLAEVEVEGLEVVDLDGDGRADLLSSDGWMIVQEHGGFRVERVPNLPERWSQVQVGDVDGDGVPDVLVEAGGEIVVVDDVAVAPRARVLPFSEVKFFRAVDLDGDGRSELGVVRTIYVEDWPFLVVAPWKWSAAGEYELLHVEYRAAGNDDPWERLDVLRDDARGTPEHVLRSSTEVASTYLDLDGEEGPAVGRGGFLPIYGGAPVVLSNVLRNGEVQVVRAGFPTFLSDGPTVLVKNFRVRGGRSETDVSGHPVRAVAAAQLFGDERQEVLVVSAPQDGGPLLEVACFGEDGELGVCGGGPLEHEARSLAVVALDGQRGTTIVYAAASGVYAVELEPRAG